MKYLQVSNRIISHNGLKTLRNLHANTESFKRLPLPNDIPQIRSISVHYPYLCCIFHKHQSEERLKARNGSLKNVKRNNIVDDPTDGAVVSDFDSDLNQLELYTDLVFKRETRHDKTVTRHDFVFPTFIKPTDGGTGLVNPGGGGFSGNRTTSNKNITDVINFNNNLTSWNCSHDDINCQDGYGGFKLVDCTPKPNHLTPCEDMLSEWYLKIPEWIMFLTTLFANALVIIVLTNSDSNITVTKFLICNLAIADFCMGIYLGIMAVTDLITAGNYANYAINWQTGAGCKLAGFIAIFATELSVYTLSVITVERYLAIAYAMYYEKQMKLRGACYAMVIGWLLAIILAALPLVGVNDYSLTCICLPSDFRNSTAIGYLLLLVITNGLSFLLILYFYAVMYYHVNQNRSEMNTSTMQKTNGKVAKRMAWLIFTNFACWTPTAIVGFATAFNLPLTTVSGAKFLLVFVFPLNAAANPFLYSIFNKLFQNDLNSLLKKCGLARFQFKRTPSITASRSTRLSYSSNYRKRLSGTVENARPVGSSFNGVAHFFRTSSSDIYNDDLNSSKNNQATASCRNKDTTNSSDIAELRKIDAQISMHGENINRHKNYGKLLQQNDINQGNTTMDMCFSIHQSSVAISNANIHKESMV